MRRFTKQNDKGSIAIRYQRKGNKEDTRDGKISENEITKLETFTVTLPLNNEPQTKVNTIIRDVPIRK